jgi:uncharacterized protein YndB with AHSA1/START domain
LSTIDIDRSPDEVFAYVTDPTRFAESQCDVESCSTAAKDDVFGSRF